MVWYKKKQNKLPMSFFSRVSLLLSRGHDQAPRRWRLALPFSKAWRLREEAALRLRTKIGRALALKGAFTFNCYEVYLPGASQGCQGEVMS